MTDHFIAGHLFLIPRTPVSPPVAPPTPIPVQGSGRRARDHPTEEHLMDPNSGRLYPSLDAAYRAGVKEPVEITGTEEQVQRISDAVASLHDVERRAKKRAKNKAAKAARRASR